MATDTETEFSDPIEGEIIAIETTALEAINRSEIDQQITTAKRYPRSLTAFKRQALEFATLDEDTAASMFYLLPRGGKRIEGPSVRLAEVVGSCWGNLRYGARIVATDDKFVTAQGMCFDLEKNISAAIEVKRRITDKNGRRFNDDMIQVTCNAACSIALRQAVFKVVPFAFVKPIFEQAKLTSIGKAESMDAKRGKMLDWFQNKLGVSQDQVLAAIERRGIEEITIDDLIALKGIATAIKDGETTIDEAFAPQQSAGGRVKTSDLGDRVKNKQAAQQSTEPTSTGEQKPTDESNAAIDWPNRIEACTTLEAAQEIDDALFGPHAIVADESILDACRTLLRAKRDQLHAAANQPKDKKPAQKTAFDNTPHA